LFDPYSLRVQRRRGPRLGGPSGTAPGVDGRGNLLLDGQEVAGREVEALRPKVAPSLALTSWTLMRRRSDQRRTLPSSTTARVVAALHSRGTVHGRLRPECVLRRSDGWAVARLRPGPRFRSAGSAGGLLRALGILDAIWPASVPVVHPKGTAKRGRISGTPQSLRRHLSRRHQGWIDVRTRPRRGVRISASFCPRRGSATEARESNPPTPATGGWRDDPAGRGGADGPRRDAQRPGSARLPDDTGTDGAAAQ
jgi:hypothetical protein